MSEKGQGEMRPVGTGTVLAEPGGQGASTAPASEKYEGRQPTDAEREAGRWLDEPEASKKYEGRQPTEAERQAGRWLDEPTDAASKPGGEWIDENTFVGPGGTPFEFQPTAGKQRGPGTGRAAGARPSSERSMGASTEPPTGAAPDPMMGEDVYAKPSAPGTSDEPSVLEHMGTAEMPPPLRPSPATDRPEPRGPSGRASEGQTQILPPDLSAESEQPTTQESVLEHTDTEGETDSPDDDQRSVMS